MAGLPRFLAGLTAGYLHLALAAAVQVVLIPFLLSRTGSETTGVYLLLVSVAQFVAVGIGWLSGAGVRVIGESQLERGGERVRELHHAVFVGFAAYGAAVFVGCLCAAAFIGPYWLSGVAPAIQHQTRLAIVYVGAFVCINFAHQADLALLAAQFEQARANLYRVAQLVIYVLLAVPMMLLSARIDLLFLAQALAASVCFVLARLWLRSSGLLGPTQHTVPSWQFLRDLFVRVGRSYFLFGVAQFTLQLGDTLLTGAVLGPRAVAAYTVLAKVPDLLVIVCARISETLVPYLVRLDASTERRASLVSLFLSTSRLQHTVGAIAGFAYAVAGPAVLDLWVGPENRPSGWLPYAVAGMSIFLQVINKHDAILHFACARVQRLLPIQFVEALGKMGLTLLLFGRYGFVAPLIAYVIMQALGVTWWYRSSALGIVHVPWRQWFARVGAFAAALCAVAAVAVAAIRPFEKRELPQIALFGAALAVAAAVLVAPEIKRLRALLI